MNYVVPDIHNDSHRLNRLLKDIAFGADDHLFLLGDLFDRCSYDPDPVGVYFKILEIEDRCTLVSGNHDRWLAEYIKEYYETKERKRKKLPGYYYNSFDLMEERLTEADMLHVADWLLSLPLQQEVILHDKKFLLAHAMTSAPDCVMDDMYYLMGEGSEDFYINGIEGFISFCGHTSSTYFARYGGTFLGDASNSIWRNDKNNVYMMDCGCGYSGGRLSCMCLDDMRSIYE